MFHAFLIKYSEIGIKGKNRYLFEDALVRQVRRALDKIDGSFTVSKETGRVFALAGSDFDYDEAVDALRHVFGVSAICPVAVFEDQGFDQLAEDVCGYVEELYGGKEMTFKVATRRARKEYPMTSMEINAALGGMILDKVSSLKVDVHDPDVFINVEIRNNIYVYSEEIKGPGGLPVARAEKPCCFYPEA